MKNKPQGFADLADFGEDRRIEIIGKTVMEQKITAAVVVDKFPGKPERYIKKLKEMFPGIVILGRFDGPMDKMVTIQVGPPNGG